MLFTQNLRLFISPYFVSRYYRIKDIKRISRKYRFIGDLIDVGCGSKPHVNDFPDSNYKGIDFDTFSTNKDFSIQKPDYYFEKSYLNNFILPFGDNEFNHAVSFQVIEHHPEPLILIKELARVIKPNGLIFITAPFLGGLHEEPYDYQRLTKYKIINFLENNNCEVVEFSEEGSLFSTIAMLLNEQNNAFASQNKFTYVLATVLHAVLIPISYLSLFGDRLCRSKTIYFNYAIVARKK